MNKRKSGVLIIILLIGIKTHAQGLSRHYHHLKKKSINYLDDKPFKPGDLVLGPYLGIKGEMDVHYYQYMSALKGISVDYGLPYRMDSGYFAIGLMTGCRYATKYYIYPISIFGKKYYYDRRWDWMTFEGRLTYHIDLLSVQNLDTYVGAIASYNTVRVIYTDNLYTDPKMLGNPYPLPFKNFVKYGIMIGARYNFYNHFGAVAEAHTGITWFAFGLTYKI